MAKPAPENKNAPLATISDIPDFDTKGWVDEQVGFAAYWTPDAGKQFIARLVGKEEARSEMDFSRYLLQAAQDIACQRGPANEAEPVTVKKGEFFTISVYYSLQGIFDFYLENQFTPWMQITSLEERPTKKPGQTVWTWALKVDPKDKKQADKLRMAAKENAKSLPESKETNQLEG